ncbi:formylglycine-generating enzyme family protein [Leptolyngbya boryana CZ1]|uniref:Formylglycine-generating enzyme family protein n=1 Tax=Leptolyngbya boryana CZ1 TaxID=3060204 RepID=A0AA97AQ62_LEPBY|nr:formylglycine-generating enzyme family protein [Leptolyngbya boryana]WNZ47378.1 formylglycine-generating enzyme family protein [Leptolyngbya boryana CZ1]
MIWLAARTDGDIITLDTEAQPVPEPVTTQVEQDLSSPPSSDSEPPLPNEAQAEIVPAPAEQRASLALPPNYKPIPVPDAPAISQALQLARSLRPLARRVAIGLPTILDEEATVDRIAETGIWQPVLKPEAELWLDVALVFDKSPSMCLWQRLGIDLHRLLSHYGEFRDVRVWLLRSDATGKLNLTARNGTVHKPSEILTGDRRRLVVVVSDCVSPAWHNGKMRELIATWSAKLPTVVFHVFPERLWSRTALARSITVELQGRQAGLPSNNLKPVVRSVWDQERLKASLKQADVRLPVVSLEKDALSNWAKVVAGDRSFRTLGIVWDAQPQIVRNSQQSSALSTSVLRDRIDSFLLTSSPISRQLAGLLASAPVITLPIARLIKQSMLPEASAVHMAEVFMSGLLKVSGSQVPTFENAERVAYELVDDEVRDRLQAGSLVIDALTVLEAVSRYVAQGLGKSVSEFKALLRSPATGKTTAETEFLSAFATVTAKILRGLGDEFEAIAHQIQPLELAPSERSFPPLETFQFIDAQLEGVEIESSTESPFPPLETQEVEVITIVLEDGTLGTEIRWQLLEYEVATIERRTDPPQTGFFRNIFRREDQRSQWVIRKQRQQRVCLWIERLTSGVDLEMVLILGRSFVMGSPENEPERLSSEGSQHEVSLPPFMMGRYPVTQAQWRAVASLPRINRELDPSPSEFKGDKRPVEGMSWYDAVEFCERLSAYTGREYRLPTEAEWEYACRAGTATPFHFGETITSDLANYDGSITYNNGPKGKESKRTTPVDQFRVANAFGLCDMHGNVFEWCQDHWHESYEGAPIDGSAWLTDQEDAHRVIRGGSWGLDPRYCRSAYRNYYSPDIRYFNIGFRVVCSAPRTL